MEPNERFEVGDVVESLIEKRLYRVVLVARNRVVVRNGLEERREFVNGGINNLTKV